MLDNEYVYARAHSKITGRYNRIIRINTNNYKAEVLYEGQPERQIAFQFWKYDQTIAFIERKRKKDFHDIQLVLVDKASKEVTRIPLEYQLLEKSYWPTLIETDIAKGKRF
ncbi:MAG: hypothetical protein GTO16_06520 [Candidatus Aminicenantes bacterium]|nr:hypothetical protein [Candidatus Aminicenantes bacterium]